MRDVLIPGGRDVRGTLEEPTDDPRAIVVACPPHPRHGGSRSDPRLVAVSDALSAVGIACLRFDYGTWDDGHGERADVRNAVWWAREEYDGLPVGVFGYSFGATLALLVSADTDPDAVAVLAPTAQLGESLDALEAVADIACPLQVLYGERDTTAEWEPVVDRATEHGAVVTALPSDHSFRNQHPAVADAVIEFLGPALCESACKSARYSR
ncbi:alpha/beta hydrolase [Natrinema sp. 74]|uniref:alpha/beta hydrolase n=1 Tax=Natrinema sp. 74 TaxID=3384159 RepID=UPI0038D35A25